MKINITYTNTKMITPMTQPLKDNIFKLVVAGRKQLAGTVQTAAQRALLVVAVCSTQVHHKSLYSGSFVLYLPPIMISMQCYKAVKKLTFTGCTAETTTVLN